MKKKKMTSNIIFNKIFDVLIVHIDDYDEVMFLTTKIFHYYKKHIINHDFESFFSKKNVKFIGLFGKIGSGKTTTQNLIYNFLQTKENLIVESFNFSDSLKQLCNEIFEYIPEKAFFGSQKDKNENYSSYYNLSGRKIMQIIGTDVFRSLIDENYWVKISIMKLFKKYNENQTFVFICGDIRFENELNIIKKFENNIIIKIERNFNDYQSTHISEELLSFFSYDFLITNNINNIDELKKKINSVINNFLFP